MVVLWSTMQVGIRVYWYLELEIRIGDSILFHLHPRRTGQPDRKNMHNSTSGLDKPLVVQIKGYMDEQHGVGYI